MPEQAPSAPIPEEQGVDPNELMKQMDHVLQYGTTEELLARIDGGELGVDQTDFSGRTPLMLKTAHGQLDAVDELLGRGADVNAVYWHQNRVPNTALDAARQTGRPEIAERLEAIGAKSGRELDLERPQ